MKFKKMKALFKAIESISKYQTKDVYKGSSFYLVKTDSGIMRKPITILPANGKYCLSETTTICKILRSIEPIKLKKEVVNVNNSIGFDLLALEDGLTENQKYLIVNTVHGAICLNVLIDDM